jgi:hypothetical protein
MNRTLYVFIILTLIAFLVVLTPYLLKFNLQFSENSQDWANFGSYVGGALSPIIATLALFGLGLSIYHQQKQMNINQIESSIRNIESDFISGLKSTSVTIKDRQFTCYEVLTALDFPCWKEVIPHKDAIDSEKSYDYFNDELRLFEVFGVAAGNLNQLRLYANKHEEVSKTNILSKYYARKYKVASLRFTEMGHLKADIVWKSV